MHVDIVLSPFFTFATIFVFSADRFFDISMCSVFIEIQLGALLLRPDLSSAVASPEICSQHAADS